MKVYNSIPEKMQKHSELINNSITDTEIAAEVATYGYSEEKLNQGKILLDEAYDLIRKQGDEDIEKKHAGKEFNEQRDQIQQQFMVDRKLGRVALRNNPELLQVNLGVVGEISTAYPKWLSQVEQFYGNTVKSGTILSAFANLNKTKGYFEQQLTEIEALKELKLNQKKEMGEAQMSTQERDEKLVDLDAWANDYKVVARIVFEDKPQVLEKLGIVVRS